MKRERRECRTRRAGFAGLQAAALKFVGDPRLLFPPKASRVLTIPFALPLSSQMMETCRSFPSSSHRDREHISRIRTKNSHDIVKDDSHGVTRVDTDVGLKARNNPS